MNYSCSTTIDYDSYLIIVIVIIIMINIIVAVVIVIIIVVIIAIITFITKKRVMNKWLLFLMSIRRKGITTKAYSQSMNIFQTSLKTFGYSVINDAIETDKSTYSTALPG